MFEKVNPSHPDKVADRIAGALVDYAYTKQEDPRIAVEVLIGHGKALIIAETSVNIDAGFVANTVRRIAGEELTVEYIEKPQDAILAKNQGFGIHCGDNGIFKGMPITSEQQKLTEAVKKAYARIPKDGKYLVAENRFIACQSNTNTKMLRDILKKDYPADDYDVTVNPLGEWTGGTRVDSGATNRKLGSDMGDSVTGCGLHGKDLSKADVSVNIYAWIKAQVEGKPVELSCAIGDTTVDGLPYRKIVEIARTYIECIGGFEKFAEWGLY
jgi:S-adenosylmethionine synthetase